MRKSSEMRSSCYAQEASTELEDARSAATAAAAQRDEALQERDALASDKATLGRHLDAANARLTAVGSSHPSKCEVLLIVVLASTTEHRTQVCGFVQLVWTCCLLAGVHWHHRTAGTCARPGAVRIQSTPRSGLGLNRLLCPAAVLPCTIPGVPGKKGMPGLQTDRPKI
jgi:hypothetical protein